MSEKQWHHRCVDLASLRVRPFVRLENSNNIQFIVKVLSPPFFNSHMLILPT